MRSLVVESTSVPRLPRAIPGKPLTLVVLAVLGTCGFFFYAVVNSYAAYNAARRQTDSSWRELAGKLDIRYRQLDRLIAKGVDGGTIDMRLGEKWRSVRDAFSGTSLSNQQTAAACELESLLAQMPQQVIASDAETDSGAKPTSELIEAVEKYQAAAANQREIGQTAGSRLLKSMLILVEPPKFELAEPANGSK